MRTKLVCKNFCDKLEDNIGETNRSELIDHRSDFFLRNGSNQSIVEISEINDTIIELVE